MKLTRLSVVFQSYRNVTRLVTSPHIFTGRSVERLEQHHGGVRAATKCWLNSQLQRVFLALFVEMRLTFTFLDSGHGMIILERKVIAEAKCSRNCRRHGNVYLCVANQLHLTSCSVVVRLQ